MRFISFVSLHLLSHRNYIDDTSTNVTHSSIHMIPYPLFCTNQKFPFGSCWFCCRRMITERIICASTFLYLFKSAWFAINSNFIWDIITELLVLTNVRRIYAFSILRCNRQNVLWQLNLNGKCQDVYESDLAWAFFFIYLLV